MKLRIGAAIVFAALLAAGCTGSTNEDSDPGRLVVVQADGNVAVVGPDGSDRVTLTSDGTPDLPYFQPIWSRDGSAVAYSRLGPQPTLNVTSVDGATKASITTTSGTFYYSWSSQDDLLFLSNAAAGLRLDLTSFDGSDLTDPRTVATGAPLYFSWDPDGGRMATHISLDRFELSDLDRATDLGPEPGVFQAPQWTDRGIVAVETHAGAPRLIVVSPDDGAVEPLATLIGPAYFVASPDGTRVAVQAITDEGDILSAIYQPIPAVPSNRLAVVDTERAEVTSVTNGLVLAFFWSPDGTRLLVLDVTPDGVATWNVWDGDELREVVQFRPAETFVRNVLPFFDQYAQSMSLWSPDGSRFAFPGTIDGEEGIWVQPLDGERRLVSDGTWVSWSS